jgi:hypothetical protein
MHLCNLHNRVTGEMLRPSSTFERKINHRAESNAALQEIPAMKSPNQTARTAGAEFVL